MKHKLVVFYGVSAGGKSKVQKSLKGIYRPITTATTRNQRDGEINGIHYHFKTVDEFEEADQNGEILERNEYLGNHYGTPLSSVEEAINGDEIRTLVLDIKGMRKLKCTYGNKVLAIYIGANIESIERRLKHERKSSKEEIDKRLEKAINEELQSSYIQAGDFIIWNNDGTDFNNVLKQIIDLIEEKF